MDTVPEGVQRVAAFLPDLQQLVTANEIANWVRQKERQAEEFSSKHSLLRAGPRFHLNIVDFLSHHSKTLD